MVEHSNTEDPWALKVLAAVAELGPKRHYDPIITSEVVKNDLVSLIGASKKLLNLHQQDSSQKHHVS
mgnify:CR=1 FL=1